MTQHQCEDAYTQDPHNLLDDLVTNLKVNADAEGRVFVLNQKELNERDKIRYKARGSGSVSLLALVLLEQNPGSLCMRCASVIAPFVYEGLLEHCGVALSGEEVFNAWDGDAPKAEWH